MPGSPFTFGITIFDTDGTTAMPNVVVNIRNEKTNDSATANTNASGQVVFQLGNSDILEKGWTVGDILTYYVLYNNFDASASLPLTDTGGTTVELTLSAIADSSILRYFTVQEFFECFELVTIDSDSKNGVKPQTVVKVGESIERSIDRITGKKWDSNNGEFYTETQELHNSNGDINQWPDDTPNISSQSLYFLKYKPIQDLTTFEVNKNGPNQVADWNTLTEADNQITVKKSIGRIRIVDVSDLPAAGEDQVRVTYTHGESSVDADIKRLAILKTGKAFASQALQRLNIDVTESQGLNSAIQNMMNYDSEIKEITDSVKFVDIRTT